MNQLFGVFFGKSKFFGTVFCFGSPKFVDWLLGAKGEISIIPDYQ